MPTDCVVCSTAGRVSAVKCDSCQRQVHAACSGLSDCEMKCLESKQRTLKFFCPECLQGPSILRRLAKLEADVAVINQSPNRQAGSTSADGDSDIHCKCGVPARKFIVKKDGPTKGRPFYKCPKFDEGCKFFAWADEGSSTSFRAGSSANGRSNDQGNGGTKQEKASDSRKKKRCGLCKEEGHTKRTCQRVQDLLHMSVKAVCEHPPTPPT